MAEYVAGCELRQVAHVGAGAVSLRGGRESEHRVGMKDAAMLLFPHAREEPGTDPGAVAADGHLTMEVAPALRGRFVPVLGRLRVYPAAIEPRAPVLSEPPAEVGIPRKALRSRAVTAPKTTWGCRWQGCDSP